jgi:hypothetical protein
VRDSKSAALGPLGFDVTAWVRFVDQIKGGLHDLP